MALQHQSWFHYSLERPYPFRWFTPVFASLAAVFAVLFTFINLAADGYTQKVVYTTNPNSTLGEHHWYMKAPWSWISTAQFSCQSPGITIGSPYYTSNQNTASYTVENMNTTLPPAADGDAAAEVYSGLNAQSLGITTYMNNTLRSCEMGTMELVFTSGEEPTSAQVQIQTGPIYCYIEAEKVIHFTLQQTFTGTDFLFDQRSSLSQYLVYDFMKQSYTALMNTIYAMNSTAEYTGTTMSLQVSANQDITSAAFLTASLVRPGASANLLSSSSSNDTSPTPFPLAEATPTNLARLLDAFAKSYYSTVMWDLAFNRTTNAFASQSATASLQHTINDAAAAAAGEATIGNLSVLGTSELQGSPAQFSVQYICSVPRQKDTGSLVISVAVADIVLLSAFWKMFEIVARRYLVARDRTWNVCPGCLELGGGCDDGGGGGGGFAQGSSGTRRSMRMMRRGGKNSIWQLDQDPLCQNGDSDQETLYSQPRSQPDLCLGKGNVKCVQSAGSVSTRDSQSTLRAVEEKDAREGRIVAGEYLALS